MHKKITSEWKKIWIPYIIFTHSINNFRKLLSLRELSLFCFYAILDCSRHILLDKSILMIQRSRTFVLTDPISGKIKDSGQSFAEQIIGTEMTIFFFILLLKRCMKRKDCIVYLHSLHFYITLVFLHLIIIWSYDTSSVLSSFTFWHCIKLFTSKFRTSWVTKAFIIASLW